MEILKPTEFPYLTKIARFKTNWISLSIWNYK